MIPYLVKDLFRYNKDIRKRYTVIFDAWDNEKLYEEIEQFDTLQEVEEYEELIKGAYRGTKRPEKVSRKLRGYSIKEISYDGGAKYWGYVVLDNEECNVISVKYDGIKIQFTSRPSFNSKTRNDEHVRDYFFRNVDEVPENYRWDEGEYEGWLRFRWGDGKNALDYKKPYKPKRKTTVEALEISEEETIEDEFDKEIVKETEKRRMDKFGW